MEKEIAFLGNAVNNPERPFVAILGGSDVYKRQDQMTLDGPQRKGDLRRSRAAAVNIVPNSTGAVSYTHLDVYKRQAMWACRHV